MSSPIRTTPRKLSIDSYDTEESEHHSQDSDQQDEQKDHDQTLKPDRLCHSMRRRLGIHLMLYKYNQQKVPPKDPLLTKWERAYIVVWWALLSVSIYFAYKFSPKQQLSLVREFLYWVIIFAVIVAMAVPNCMEKRNWVLEKLLKLDPTHSDRYNDQSRVAQFYNGLKMWLLMPLVFLGIWAPWAPATPRWAWTGAILPTLCIAIGMTTLGFDTYHMIRVTTHGTFNSHAFNKCFWALVFDTCEMLTYTAAVIIFNQPKTVKELFQFDNTERTVADIGLGTTINSGLWDNTQSPFSHYCRCSLDEPDEENADVEDDRKDKSEKDIFLKIVTEDGHYHEISDRLVYTAWKWVVWLLSPALMYCYVAYVSSILFDAPSHDWRTLSRQNGWLPWVYDVSPFGGTNFSVGSGYVSGVLLVLAAHVWFVCMTVSMELNRIAIQRARGDLNTAELYASIQRVRDRMDVLVDKFKYIIAIQFTYCGLLLTIIFVHVFRVVPTSTAVIECVNGWTGVSAFVLVFEFVVTAYYASRIYKQWDMIINVVVGQQHKHLCNPEAVPQDFALIYDHLKLSPFGIRIFGFAINRTFVKTLALGVLTQVAGFLWTWFTHYLKSRA